MNRSKTSYIMKRIDEVTDEKINTILTEEHASMCYSGYSHRKRSELFDFSISGREQKDDIDKAVKKVGIKLLPVAKIKKQITDDMKTNWYTRSSDLISNRDAIVKEKERMAIERAKKATARVQKLKKAVTSVKDKIMLGDESEALESLEIFASKSF